MTAPVRLRPTFLVIGAQKSGTTSLHEYLAAHPGVLVANTRAVRYFSLFYSRGDHWYASHFPLATRAVAVRRDLDMRPRIGETSTTYLFDPRVPERVHTFNPRMKLISALRDPVDRAYSHYQMEHRWGREPGSFEEALAREERELPEALERIERDPSLSSDVAARIAYVARGRYAEQLERWLELFPREQLFVLTSDELLAAPAEVMSRIADFLEIPEWRAPAYPLRGVREYAPMAPATRERLVHTFEPENRLLAELLARELPWTTSPTRAATRPVRPL
ncbi:MAG: sulfotransferase [Thermoleophilia bacterium]|nr:sulfotransferase [Thermoleophilia bacterium]